jgi:hypothetical protein
VDNNNALRDRKTKCDIFDDMKTSRHFNGGLPMLQSFHGDSIGDSLHSDLASTAFFALSLRFCGTHSALKRR